MPDLLLKYPAHQEVQQSCIDASGDSQSAEHTLLKAQPWPAPACLKLFGTETLKLFGTETQMFFQLLQARRCRPQACGLLEVTTVVQHQSWQQRSSNVKARLTVGMSTLHPFPSRWDVLWACLREDTGAPTFSFNSNTQSSKKESLRQEPLPLLLKGKVSHYFSRSQSKGPTLLLESTVQDTLAPVSVPSQMMSSCSVLATLSCSFGQEGWLRGGCPELLLQDLVHIPTHFPKPASLCTAKTLLLSFNLPLLLTKTRG